MFTSESFRIKQEQYPALTQTSPTLQRNGHGILHFRNQVLELQPPCQQAKVPRTRRHRRAVQRTVSHSASAEGPEPETGCSRPEPSNGGGPRKARYSRSASPAGPRPEKNHSRPEPRDRGSFSKTRCTYGGVPAEGSKGDVLDRSR